MDERKDDIGEGRVSRRRFLAGQAAGVLAAGCVFSAAHSQTLSLTRAKAGIEGLPQSLSGLKVAFAADFHHSVYVPVETVRKSVDLINSLSPDVILLGGDYVTILPGWFKFAFRELGKLECPLGVYSVPGNHDYLAGIDKYRDTLSATGIVDITNTGFAVGEGADKLWIAGLDDSWTGTPDAGAAVADAPNGAPRIVVTHSPNIADDLEPGYADLILAGHTHGWQIYIPGVTRLFVPSKGLKKYRSGFYGTPAGKVYVTRGVGLSGIPIRLWASPEVVLFTLVPA